MFDLDVKEDLASHGPGAVLKAVRAAKGWTLAEVKDRTGLSISTLSKIENGRMGLSYDKLMKLGEGLGVDVGQLLTGNSRPGEESPRLISGRRTITRKGEGPGVETSTYTYSYHAAELLGKSMDPMMIEVTARSIDDFEDFTRHDGEEYACVLDGSVDFHSDLYAPTRLSEGDSIYFDAAMGHAYVAASPGRCRILVICAGASELPVSGRIIES